MNQHIREIPGNPVEATSTLIVTAQPEFLSAALDEIRQIVRRDGSLPDTFEQHGRVRTKGTRKGPHIHPQPPLPLHEGMQGVVGTGVDGWWRGGPLRVSSSPDLPPSQESVMERGSDRGAEDEGWVHLVELLAPGIALCTVPEGSGHLQRLAAEHLPIFVRHIAPVQAIVKLTNTERDIAELALAIAGLPSFEMLERGQHFAVQTRIVQTDEHYVERPYSSGRLNQLLAEAIAEETGAVESIKKPQIVVSLLSTAQKGYLGISTAKENLSDWPGGMRHFAQTPEQISRSEFKLLEALETFGVTLPVHGRALDLGAAPGGWTRLLLEAGMSVIAVDPARLDPRLAGHAQLEHYRGYAEVYLEDAIKKHRKFDVITNDMRMDAREAARLLIQAGKCLRSDGFVISTLKLPHATHEIDPLKNLKAALSLLHKHFGIVQAHQLFHNRQEVTVIAAQPHPEGVTFIYPGR